MLSRLSLMFTLVAALAAGVVTTNVAAQKDKTKSKDQAESKEQKEKDKTLFDSNNGLVALELGAGGCGYLGVYLEEVTAERVKGLGLKEERGAGVMKGVGDSAAAKGGLKEK